MPKVKKMSADTRRRQSKARQRIRRQAPEYATQKERDTQLKRIRRQEMSEEQRRAVLDYENARKKSIRQRDSKAIKIIAKPKVIEKRAKAAEKRRSYRASLTEEKLIELRAKDAERKRLFRAKLAAESGTEKLKASKSTAKKTSAKSAKTKKSAAKAKTPTKNKTPVRVKLPTKSKIKSTANTGAKTKTVPKATKTNAPSAAQEETTPKAKKSRVSFSSPTEESSSPLKKRRLRAVK